MSFYEARLEWRAFGPLRPEAWLLPQARPLEAYCANCCMQLSDYLYEFLFEVLLKYAQYLICGVWFCVCVCLFSLFVFVE